MDGKGWRGGCGCSRPRGAASAPAQRFYLYRSIYGTFCRVNLARGELGSRSRQRGMQSQAKKPQQAGGHCGSLQKIIIKRRDGGRGARKQKRREKNTQKTPPETTLKYLCVFQVSIQCTFSCIFPVPNVFILHWKKPILIFFPIPCIPLQQLFSV